jgi:formamidopyrimidine-DNA glycosylase
VPEYPDIELYLHALRPRVVGRVLERVRIVSPFLLRSVEPPLETVLGDRVGAVHRLGKRIVLETGRGVFLVIHLMIAGRLRWKEPGAPVPGRIGLAAFDFEHGTLLLTEAGSKRHASLYVVEGRDRLQEHDPGGIDVFTATPQAFAEQLRRESHTLKRALTDPRLFSGIGNAYSDEILLAAGLSPMQLTSRLSDAQIEALLVHVRSVLTTWKDRLIAEAGDHFPDKVTAFRDEMAAHGRFGKPCPVCGTAIQRIKYASNEANYCPTCQTGGRLLADRGLSRLLKEDWPRTLEELERFKAQRS